MSEFKPNRLPRAGGQITTPRRASTYLLPTLLDRLRDDEPQQHTEAPDAYAVTRAQMRDILQRDLAFLLNTTSIEDQIDRARYPKAAASTVNFGVPPLAGAYIASRKWTQIEQTIRRAILDFEPRLIPATLAVTPRVKDPGDNHYNVLLFEIRGLIHMDPYPLELLVQSSIDLETSRMHVSDVRVN